MTKRKNLERNGVFLDKNFALGLVMLKPVGKMEHFIGQLVMLTFCTASSF